MNIIYMFVCVYVCCCCCVGGGGGGGCVCKYIINGKSGWCCVGWGCLLVFGVL